MNSNSNLLPLAWAVALALAPKRLDVLFPAPADPIAAWVRGILTDPEWLWGPLPPMFVRGKLVVEEELRLPVELALEVWDAASIPLGEIDPEGDATPAELEAAVERARTLAGARIDAALLEAIPAVVKRLREQHEKMLADGIRDAAKAVLGGFLGALALPACPVCGKPAHPGESDENGRCIAKEETSQ